MQRYFLQLAYKGSRYHGWQVQANALSIQTVLETALSTLLRQPIETTGCGRTDTGVHATDFYVHFDYEHSLLMPDESFIYHLNCVLPDDVAVKKISRVHESAHARFDALSRTYRYYISFKKDPFLKDRAMYCRGELNLAAMQAACPVLLEYVDFNCFCKNRTQVKTTLCKLMDAKWEIVDETLCFEITANRFLRNMVRAIVGTMLEIGKGRMNLEELRTLIESGKRSDAGASVPAEGLFLVKVAYPPELVGG